MDEKKLKNILEASLLVAARVMSLAQLEALFQNDEEKPERKQIRAALDALKQDYEGRGIELVEVASGYRLQSHESVSGWVANLFQEKAPRYSRALLETLVLIAYRQPITRSEIEEVRGVAVSSNIIKTLQERQWVKVLGHKEVPGRPALLGTTKAFLDYFNLKKLDELPELSEIKDLDQFDELLAEEVGEVGEVGEVNAQGDAANDDSGDQSQTASDAQNQSEADSQTGQVTQSGPQSKEQSDANRISKMSAMLDLGAVGEAVAVEPDSRAKPDDAADSESDIRAAADNEGSVDTDGNDKVGPDHDDSVSGAERKLLRVISDFSDEHQQEIDARDELESALLSADDKQTDENSISDLSQRIGDDQQSGDMPDPGDTLH